MDQLPSILATVKGLGHVVFDGGPYDLNIIGVRSKNPVVNTFCDKLHVVYREAVGGPWVEHIWPITTDPGIYWLQQPMNVHGTAILIPGQYRGSHAIGMHRNEYRALVQVGTLRLWMDNNKDSVLDHDPNSVIQGTGFGINIHHAGDASTQVYNWSAGCQVAANLKDFNDFMAIIDLAAAKWGPKFTYTLIDEV